MKTVKDVMSANPVSVRKTTSVKEVAAMLREFRVSAFPVVDEAGKVVGVVSEADLMVKQAVADGSGRGKIIASLGHHRVLRKVNGITAGDLMTSPAVTVTGQDTIDRAARLMHRRGLKRLVVIDAD